MEVLTYEMVYSKILVEVVMFWVNIRGEKDGFSESSMYIEEQIDDLETYASDIREEWESEGFLNVEISIQLPDGSYDCF